MQVILHLLISTVEIDLIPQPVWYVSLPNIPLSNFVTLVTDFAKMISPQSLATFACQCCTQTVEVVVSEGIRPQWYRVHLQFQQCRSGRACRQPHHWYAHAGHEHLGGRCQ